MFKMFRLQSNLLYTSMLEATVSRCILASRVSTNVLAHFKLITRKENRELDGLLTVYVELFQQVCKNYDKLDAAVKPNRFKKTR